MEADDTPQGPEAQGSEGSDPAWSLELFTRAKGGDDRALCELLAHHQEFLLRVARRKLGPRLRSCLESMDVVQEANAVVMRKLGELEVRDRASLLAWLAKIVENKVTDAAAYHNAQRRDAEREQRIAAAASESMGGAAFPSAGDTHPPDRAARAELRDAVLVALKSLTPEQREVIRLRDYERRDWADIATAIGRPNADAAAAFHRRAFEKLRAKVNPGEKGPSDAPL